MLEIEINLKAYLVQYGYFAGEDTQFREKKFFSRCTFEIQGVKTDDIPSGRGKGWVPKYWLKLLMACCAILKERSKLCIYVSYL
jgi:hypothetical protein